MDPKIEGFHKLVVGVDLSLPSQVAVAQAMSVARRMDAPVVMMMVEPDVDEQGRFAADRTGIEELRQRLLGQGVELSHVVTAGDADSGLADAAARLGADLIAVGTHGHRGVRRMLLGSVAEMTVRLASVSVLVARGSETAAEGGYRRILVGTDFSPLADRAIARAAALAAPGATIEVMHAWHVPYDISPDGSMMMAIGTMRESLIEGTDRTLAALAASWKARGVTLTTRSIEASAREALVERAAGMQADLVVVGSHGRRGVRRLFLGSVAESTVRLAPCSVLVAR